MDESVSTLPFNTPSHQIPTPQSIDFDSVDFYSALRLTPTQLNVISFIGAGGKSTAMFRLANEMTQRGQRVITTTTTRIAADQILSAPTYVSLDGTGLPIIDIRSALDAHRHCMVIGRSAAQRLIGDKKAGIEPVEVDALVTLADELRVSNILVEADGSRMLPAKAPADHEPAVPSSTTLVVSLIGMDAMGLPVDEPFMHRPETMRRLLNASLTTPIDLTPTHVVQLLNHPQGGRRRVPEYARFVPVLNKTDTPPRLAQARLIASQLARTGQSSLIGAVGGTGAPIHERWGRCVAVVLAAGGSERFGRPKQLAVVDDEAMVLRAVRTALQSGVHQVLVVTGAYDKPITELLAAHGYHESARPDHLSPAVLQIVHNHRWQEGQATSVHAALDTLSSEIEAAIFLPVDQPYLPVSLLRRLLRAWRSGSDLAAPAVNDQVRGAPALFARRFWPELLAVRGDIGGRNILRQNRIRVATLPVHASALIDINTVSDLP